MTAAAPTTGRRGYRPALDGVRGAAVLAIIAYHVGGVLPGGFLAVDTFFVLSGYLITDLLLGEHAAKGRIALREFWARRARRLLPALLLLIGVVAIVIAASAPISTLAERRSDMVSALLYAANWHFIASDQSYFAAFQGVSPLRHVWTLAIEEQFYIVWPLLAVVALRGVSDRRGYTRVLIAVLAGAVLSALMMLDLYNAANPSRAYYGTDARAHQLLLGAALAILLRSRPELLTGERARAAVRWVWPPVVLLGAVALLTVHDQDAFYYRGGSLLFALTVAVGLWCIEVAPRSPPARVLSLRPLAWTGVISYGLYLWHWPFIVWIGKSAPGADPWYLQVAEVASTFAAAAASYHLLESRVRRGRMPWLGFSRRRLAVAAVVGAEVIAALVVISTIVDADSAVGRGLVDKSDTPCPAGSPSVDGRTYCARTPGRGRSPLVVATAGDSTSRAFDPGMTRVAARRGWRYIQTGQGGCSFAPLVMPSDRSPASVAREQQCVAAVRAMLAAVLAREDPDVWIVSDRVPILPLLYVGGRALPPGDPRRDRVIRAAVTDALDRLGSRGARVVVVSMPPPAEPADCVVNHDSDCRSKAYTRHWGRFRRLARLQRQAVAASRRRARYLGIDDLMCPAPGGRCPALLGGVLGRFDQVHLTATYSRRLVPRIVARAERLGALRKR